MKNKRKIISIIVIAIVAIYALLQVIPYSNGGDNKFRIEKGERPLVMAHGGAKLLYPENTKMAFNGSYDMGVDVLEMDLCMTKDGVLLTHHNLTIDATTEFEGKVNDYTYEEILAMNFGYDFKDLDGNYPYRNETDEKVLATLVPMTVEEMFQAFGKDVLYIMEIKDKGETGKRSADILNEMIRKYGLEEHVCVASFDKVSTMYFESIKPEKTLISMDLSTATDFVIGNLAGYGAFLQYDHAGLQLPMKQSGINLELKYLIYKIHHNNMFVHYWTINDKDDMIRLIKKGADGIITDRPDLMLEALEELGY